MKRSEIIFVLSLIFVSMGGTFLFFKIKHMRVSQITTPVSITEYNEILIPLYQAKAQTVQKLLVESKSQSGAISGFLAHAPNWKANNFSDVTAIEEVNSHLDTHLSELVIATKVLYPSLKEIEKIDQAINQARSKLIPKNIVRL
ncbi:MAG: hypothetical protein FMNOHCHN_03622 [Ignavibacteriaceae bacterium]|nr:hypothetical protein [Ignavibacteriaceae bacterium]GIL17924.1 MAG: hypothetical protein BroJett040_16750 [Oligoflexia bacterium]